MKPAIVLLMLTATIATAQPVIHVQGVAGEALVRHGVSETWIRLVRGDTLHADDAIRTGMESSIALTIGNATAIRIPGQVILEVIDLRKMTQEELLLKLALQDVRSIPSGSGEKDLSIPRTSTVHGDPRNGAVSKAIARDAQAALQMNGARVLYDQGFFETSILRSKEVIRRDPAMASQVDARLRIASAFEKIRLRREALNEYQEIVKLPLEARQRQEIEVKITELQKRPAEGMK